MAGVREGIRRWIPFSAQAFEAVEHRRRRRASRPQIETIPQGAPPITLDVGGGYRKGTNGLATVDAGHSQCIHRTCSST